MQVRQCPECESQNVVSTKEREHGQPVCRCRDCGYTSNIASFGLAELRDVRPNMLIQAKKGKKNA